MNTLYEKYIKDVMPAMKKEFGYTNSMAVPKIEKVSINVGVSRGSKDPNFIDDVVNDLTLISGQKPVRTKAKKAISGFKIREGQIVGVAVTLRGPRMWDFLDKLISAAIPRIRDFQGIEPKHFDRQGNFSYAIKEQLVFPEISHDEIKSIFSLQVNVKTSANNQEEGRALIMKLGFPIKK